MLKPVAKLLGSNETMKNSISDGAAQEQQASLPPPEGDTDQGIVEALHKILTTIRGRDPRSPVDDNTRIDLDRDLLFHLHEATQRVLEKPRDARAYYHLRVIEEALARTGWTTATFRDFEDKRAYTSLGQRIAAVKSDLKYCSGSREVDAYWRFIECERGEVERLKSWFRQKEEVDSRERKWNSALEAAGAAQAALVDATESVPAFTKFRRRLGYALVFMGGIYMLIVVVLLTQGPQRDDYLQNFLILAVGVLGLGAAMASGGGDITQLRLALQERKNEAARLQDEARSAANALTELGGNGLELAKEYGVTSSDECRQWIAESEDRLRAIRAALHEDAGPSLMEKLLAAEPLTGPVEGAPDHAVPSADHTVPVVSGWTRESWFGLAFTGGLAGLIIFIVSSSFVGSKAGPDGYARETPKRISAVVNDLSSPWSGNRTGGFENGFKFGRDKMAGLTVALRLLHDKDRIRGEDPINTVGAALVRDARFTGDSEGWMRGFVSGYHDALKAKLAAEAEVARFKAERIIWKRKVIEELRREGASPWQIEQAARQMN